MGKKRQSRPAGGARKGRSGGAGTGPSKGGGGGGSGGNTGGTTHKGSAQAAAPVVGIAFTFLVVPGLVVLGVVGYLLHGHGAL